MAHSPFFIQLPREKPMEMNDKEISFLLSLKHSHTWNHTISLSFNKASMRLPISNTPVLRLTHMPIPPAEPGKEVQRNLPTGDKHWENQRAPFCSVLKLTNLNQTNLPNLTQLSVPRGGGKAGSQE